MLVSRDEIKTLRDYCDNNFWFFCQSLLEPKFYDANFHTPFCNFLQEQAGGKLVVLPRTFLKTTITSLYTLWRASKDPGIRILIVSNTSPNAEKTVRSIRSIIENDKFYQLLYSDRIPNFNRVRWSDRCACLNRPVDHPEGTFEAIGVGSNVIRRHYNIIVEDDTVAPKADELTGDEAMPTRDDIEKAVGFHKLTIPLLIDFENDLRIVVGTRWASYDLINHIKEHEKWEEFDKPAIDNSGKPLYKKFNIHTLDAIKMGLGTYMFSSLYLNQPLAKEFMAFNPDWIKYYDQLPEVEGSIVITVDPADPPTGKKTQNYSAIVAGFSCKYGLYVLDYKRGRYTPHQMIKESFDMARRWQAIKIRVEIDKYAHLQYDFKDEMERRKKHYVIDCVKTKGRNKELRIMGLAPLCEAGTLHLKRGMRELEAEMVAFPNGKFDDLIDALAWQLPSHKQLFVPEKPEEKEPPNYSRFSFDEIQKSMHRSQMKYPFSKQMYN